MTTTLERPSAGRAAHAQLNPEDAEDIEDAARVASTRRAANRAGEEPLPPIGPRDRSALTGLARLDTRWQADAACARVDADTSRRMTDALSQREVADLVNSFCADCLVRRACLTDARTIRGWGLAGGVVLIDGQRAPDRRRATPTRADTEHGDAEQPRGKYPLADPPAAAPARRPRGQRWQPQRRSRRARRARRMVAR